MSPLPWARDCQPDKSIAATTSGISAGIIGSIAVIAVVTASATAATS
jgi:hypothetical protein